MIIYFSFMIEFFCKETSKNDEFIRKRNLFIASLIIDTGVSVQNILNLILLTLWLMTLLWQKILKRDILRGSMEREAFLMWRRRRGRLAVPISALSLRSGSR